MRTTARLSSLLLLSVAALAMGAARPDSEPFELRRSRVRFRGERQGANKVSLRGVLPVDELISGFDPSELGIRVLVGEAVVLASVPYLNSEERPEPDDRRTRFRSGDRRSTFELDRATGRFRLRAKGIDLTSLTSGADRTAEVRIQISHPYGGLVRIYRTKPSFSGRGRTWRFAARRGTQRFPSTPLDAPPSREDASASPDDVEIWDASNPRVRFPDSAVFFIRANEEWNAWWRVTRPPEIPAPDIDFDEEVVLVWSQGYGTGSGSSITIDSVEREDDVLRVGLTRYTPLGVGQFLSHPVTVFRIPLTAETIQLDTRTLPMSEYSPAR